MTHRAREHPLTYGQLSVWRIMQNYPPDRFAETYLPATVPVPSTSTLDQIHHAIDTLCRRHESLRTHFVPGPSGPLQYITPPGDRRSAEIIENPGHAVATRHLARTRIDRAAEFGCRFAVTTEGGRPTEVALVVDHITADGIGLRRLCAELAALLGGGDPRGARWLAERPPQPRELAAHQRSPQGLRRAETAVAHWRDLLRTLPPDLFPLSESTGETPGRIEATLRSRQAHAALRALAARTDVSPHGLLLTLTALATSVVTERSDVVLTLQAGNRYSPRWRDIVSSMNQYAPLPLRMATARTSFADFAGYVQRSSLKAYRAGSYDIDAITELVRRERDMALGFDHFFNFMAHGTTPAPATMSREFTPGLIEESRPNRQIGPRLDVKVRGGADLPLVVRADPLLLPRPRLRALLHWFDEQLHRLATGGEATLGEVLGQCRAAVEKRAVS